MSGHWKHFSSEEHATTAFQHDDFTCLFFCPNLAEELLGRDNAIYWSPNSKKLVYASFNDSSIKKAWYPMYQNLRYSKLEEFGYPKAGFQNPTITLQVANTEDFANPVTLVPPEIISKK